MRSTRVGGGRRRGEGGEGVSPALTESPLDRLIADAAEAAAEADNDPEGPEGDEEEYDEDELEIEEVGSQITSELNDPDVRSLDEPPLLGARPQSSDVFDSMADNIGRASSPLLYAQVANLPTATQFRCWRWENGIPVAIGVIDAGATEDDFVQHFYDAMPKPGDGRFQFRIRPIDMRGKELGKEITINISEHHSMLARIRERKKRQMEEEMMGPRGQGPAGNVYVSPGDSGSGQFAEEMGRMFESAVASAEQRTQMLQEALNEERRVLREEEQKRIAERIATAERSSSVVENLTQKLMETDRQRSQEAMQQQKSAADTMLHTLTTVFAQQQEQARLQAERMREADAHRLAQDREFFERQRQELELRRQYEREEADRKRQEEADRMRMEMERKDKELEARLARERMEQERERERAKEERERWRQEIEEKRLSEQREWERKQAIEREERDRKATIEREERERRERLDRERWEREREEMRLASEKARLEYEQRREAERREFEERRLAEKTESERRAQLLREEEERRENRRREEIAIQQKQMEIAAQRDREHAERMMEMARLEREAQREAQIVREKQEREAREASERDRQRQHELQMREMEIAKERDREHAERMMQISKQNQANSGLGGLGGLTEALGMNTPELLERIFGGSGDEESSVWDKIPSMIEALAGLGKAALTPKTDGRRAITQTRVMPTPQMIHPMPVPPPQPVQPTPPPPIEPPPPTPAVEKKPEPTGDYAETLKEDIGTLVKAAKISPAEQRKHRRAIKKLAEALGATTTDEEATPIILNTFMSSPGLAEYVAAVSIYGALVDAKVEQELADRIVKGLKASPLVPADIPYTIEDVRKAKEVSPAPSAPAETQTVEA